MSDQAHTPPKRIYLQWHGDSKPEERTGTPAGVTFSYQPVHEADVEYVRQNVADALLEVAKMVKRAMASGQPHAKICMPMVREAIDQMEGE